MIHDLRDALRLFRASPGFAAVAVATIALAIGANVAMFSVAYGILLRPLPYPESDRIVRVLERSSSGGLSGISTLNYVDWAAQNSVFEYVAAEAGWQATLTGGDEPILIRGARASAHYFDIFGVRPALGRTFLPDEDQPGRDKVVLLSHRLWESRFSADPAILERDVVLNGEAYRVIGVLPKGGPFDRAAAQIWTPLAFQPSNMTRDFRWLGASAKLKSGVALSQARAEMDVIARRLARTYPDANEGRGVAVDRLADVLISPDLRAAVIVLFAATALVWLIACANLANLTLARSLARSQEVAVRDALGAGRWRLVRHALVENGVVSVCGGIAGVGVGWIMMRWIQSLIPPTALPPAVDIGLQSSALLFALIASVVTGVAFGVVPAAQSAKRSLVGALKDGRRGATHARTGRRLRNGLVVAEIALAFVLLVASGQLMRSFFRLLDIDPGFVAANVLTAGLPIAPGQHPDPVELNGYLASIRAAVGAIPGVRETALTSVLPLQGWGYGMPYSIAGRKPTDRGQYRTGFFKIVTPSYFRALGIRLVAGRLLNDGDTVGGPRVVVINETLSKREFPDEDPIGHRLLARELVPGSTGLGQEIAWDIVGVIANEKITGLGDEVSAGMYVSNEQSPTYGVDLIVQAEVPPPSLQKALRTAIDSVSKDQALSDVRTLDTVVAQSMLGNRVMNMLVTVFASLAMLLAAVGIYGVMTYTVEQRTHEMGVRAALGAPPRRLTTLVLAGGLRLTMMGLVIGFAGTFATARALSSMLYGVGAHDAMTIGVVGVVLVSVAGLACVRPARRIANVDPMEVLRNQ